MFRMVQIYHPVVYSSFAIIWVHAIRHFSDISLLVHPLINWFFPLTYTLITHASCSLHSMTRSILHAFTRIMSIHNTQYCRHICIMFEEIAKLLVLSSFSIQILQSGYMHAWCSRKIFSQFIGKISDFPTRPCGNSRGETFSLSLP